jgi:transcriptional regulator with XRE-family HTH domain
VVDGADIDQWVARRLRELRRERGITLSALSELVGISAPHLSRLEKGERQPSIGTLLQIARVYGVSVSHLVEEHEESDYRLLPAADAVSHTGQDGRYTVLSGPRATISAVRIDLAAGKPTKDARHAGEEWLHVLAGPVTLVLSGEKLSLDVGDSVHFDSARPHRLVVDSGTSATVLICSTAAAAPMHHPVPKVSKPR